MSQLPENFLNLVREREKGTSKHLLAEQRANNLQTLLKLTETDSSGKRQWNLARGLSYLMHTDRELMGEVAYLQSQKRTKNGEQIQGSDLMQRHFERLSKADNNGKDYFNRALDADMDAGGNDLADTLVEDSVIKRVEDESQILRVIRKKSTNGNKDVKFPLSSNTVKAQYATKSADLVDLSADIETGFSSITIEPEKFGATMFTEGELFVKISASLVSEIMDELRIAYRRGLSDQIFNGNNLAPNATGFGTNATAIGFTTMTETIIKMIAAVGDANRGATNGLSDVFLATNFAGGITLEAEKFVSWQHNQLIDVMAKASKTNAFLNKIDIIYDDMGVITSGVSPAKLAPLYVGIKNQYLMAEAREPSIMIDPYTDFKAAGETVRILAWHSMKPANVDSFAKTTIPAIY
jgi:HK97 family phage major capsid protein